MKMKTITKASFICLVFIMAAQILLLIPSSNSISHTHVQEAADAGLIVTVQTDKSFYTPGEKVIIFGMVQNSSGVPVEGATVSIEVKNPENTTVFLDIVFSLANGSYTDTFRLAEDSVNGEYYVYVTANAAGYVPAANQTTFTVGPAGIHNIAITEIIYTPSKPIVNNTVIISVKVENLGNFAETFDVVVNYTRVRDPIIGIQTITLNPGQAITLNFTWMPNATGRYEIKAYTSTIPNDANPSDNTKVIYLYVSTPNDPTTPIDELDQRRLEDSMLRSIHYRLMQTL